MNEFFEAQTRVRYEETDQMGVVYHSNYFVWFEIARTELIRSIGITYKEIEKTGLLLPVVDVSCKYINSAKYDDELSILVKIEKYTGLRLDFYYEVRNRTTGELLATGKTKHVFIDNDYRPKRLDKQVPEFHDKLLSIIDKYGDYNV